MNGATLHAIRLAAAYDADDIAAMSRDYIEHGLGWGWRSARVLRAMRQRDTNAVVTGPPGAIIAFGIMRYGDTRAHLQLLAVHGASQRQGAGSAVLHWLETVAVTAGIQRITLEARRSNEAARRFYLGHGYQETRTHAAMYSGMEDGVGFEKRLGKA